MKRSQMPTIVAHAVRARMRATRLHGAALTEYQDARARAQVSFAVAHAPFYRAHWAGHSLADWRTLPTVDKRLMMDHFDDFNTRGLRRDDALAIALAAERTRDFAPTLHGITVGLSSGTSGFRGLFLASPEEQAGWAGVILARALHTIRAPLRIAFFLRANSNLYETIGRSFIDLRYFDLMLPLAEMIARLTLLQPHIVVAPPSLLGMLADAQVSGLLRVRPQRLISVAEVLDPQEERRLTDVFQAPVHQIYQCTEGLLAVSCAHGALHIQEDLVALQYEALADEAEGDRGAPSDPATRTPGVADAADESAARALRVTPIITDLWRRTQPILRYRLNDVLQLAPSDARPCACGSGFRRITRVEGRADDLCFFVRRDGTRRTFFPDTIRRMVLLASADILDYRAEQERDGHLRVYVQPGPQAVWGDVAAAVGTSVRETLARYDCEPADLEVALGVPATPMETKRRRVRRLTGREMTVVAPRQRDEPQGELGEMSDART